MKFLFFLLIFTSLVIGKEMNFLFLQQDTTLITDTLTSIDTTKRSDIDSIIYAKANDSLIFFVSKKKMNLFGSGYLQYKTTELKSGAIYVDFETSNVEAFGIKDTLKDSLYQTPSLIERGDEYRGTRMKYNFKTTKGFITYAATEQDNASYSGAKIKKVNRDEYFVEHGVYSTCEAEHPHYYFFGNEMKVIQKEQVVGRWIWLVFGDVPFPIPIPFAVFPLQSGRRSGILAPAFGSGEFGRYLSRFGYYWAISDYTDASLTADYFFKGGFKLDSRFRYSKRYDYTGYFEAGYSDLHKNEITDPDRFEQINWRLRAVHNQTLTPTSRFDVNLEFLSSNYFRQTTTDYNQLLKNEIVSNATYYKNWEESGMSLTLNYNRRQELESGNISELLPNISFNKTQFYPFRKGVSNKEWYELLGFSYNSQLQNRRNKTGGNLSIRGGIRHSIGTSISPKVGYFNISPGFSYQELWYNKSIEKKIVKSNFSGKDSVVTNDVIGIQFVRTFSTGISTSTKIYGTFQPQTLGISAVRHIIEPNIGYSYTPDFSKDFWGYYGSYTDSLGNVIKYNRFEREIFGGAGSSEIQNLSFSVNNVFEMKTMKDRKDTTSQEKKFQLLNFSANINYNLAADSLKFSRLSLSYRTQLSDFLNFQGGSIYSLYEYENGREVNKFLFSEGKGLLRLTSFNFSISTSLSGERLKSSERASGQESTTSNQLEEEDISPVFQNRGSTYRGLYETEEVDFSIPWNLGLSFNYNLSKDNPNVKRIYSSLSGNASINLTKNWKVSVSGSYDFQNKQFAAPQVVISRDLHCWIMNFTWNPIGSYTGYRFEIRVKAPQLQDLKLTKTDRFFGGRR